MTIIYSISLKGRRDANQDTYNIIKSKNKKFIGLYDGHGDNSYVSKFLSKTIPKIFVNLKYPLTKTFVSKMFLKINEILKKKHIKQSSGSGSTCLIVCNYFYHLQIFNTGDSRCVLCNYQNIAIPLTKDHKPNDFDELKRIEGLGGKIHWDKTEYRIGLLAVSRSFGDFDSKYITCIPDLYKYKINKNDKFFIVACDGLWDVMSNQDAVNLILHFYNANKKINIAKKLAEHAIKLGSADNITIIIIFF